MSDGHFSTLHRPDYFRWYPYSRLEGTRAWAPQSPASWIQANFGQPFHIYKIATQGHQSQDYWVKTFKLATSSNEDETELATNYIQSPGGRDRIFQANTDHNTIVNNTFSPRVARLVRFCPITWSDEIALRWELYGCSFGVTCPQISLQNADVISTSRLGGSELTVTCVDDYSFLWTNGERSLTAHCRHTGAWSVANLQDLLCMREYLHKYILLLLFQNVLFKFVF